MVERLFCNHRKRPRVLMSWACRDKILGQRVLEGVIQQMCTMSEIRDGNDWRLGKKHWIPLSYKWQLCGRQ